MAAGSTSSRMIVFSILPDSMCMGEWQAASECSRVPIPSTILEVTVSGLPSAIKCISIVSTGLDWRRFSNGMELSTLHELSNGCLAMEVNFAFNEKNFETWGHRFAEHFAGAVHAYLPSLKGGTFKINIH